MPADKANQIKELVSLIENREMPYWFLEEVVYWTWLREQKATLDDGYPLRKAGYFHWLRLHAPEFHRVLEIRRRVAQSNGTDLIQ